MIQVRKVKTFRIESQTLLLLIMVEALVLL